MFVLSPPFLLLSLACLFCICGAFSNCGRKGGCENLVGGDQSRPILSGDQNHIDDSGRCKYGHAAVQGECQSGLECGYTLFVCACVDQETAQAEHSEKALWFLLGGIGCCIVGLGLGVGCFVVEQQKQNRDANKRFTSVVPQNGLEASEAAHDSSDPYRTSSAKSRQHCKSEDKPAMQIDGCGLFVLGILALIVVLGIVLIFISVSVDQDQYFNQCD